MKQEVLLKEQFGHPPDSFASSHTSCNYFHRAVLLILVHGNTWQPDASRIISLSAATASVDDPHQNLVAPLQYSARFLCGRSYRTTAIKVCAPL